MRKVLIGTLLILSVSLSAMGQTPGKLEFEVASVKVAPPPAEKRILVGVRGGPGTDDPGQITYNFVSITMLMTMAYNVKQYQVIGPDWINSERYNIIVKVRPGATKEDVAVMLQNLLADRFKLSTHRETKDFSLYELTVGKSGSKLKASTGDPDAPPSARPPGPPPQGKDGMPQIQAGEKGMMMIMSNGKMRISGGVQPVSVLADALGNQLNSPVIDKTGLKGVFDFSLEFAPDTNRMGDGRLLFPPPPPPPGTDAAKTDAPSDVPPLLTAVQEQLGLKLEKTKGPLDVIVIDKGEKVPTDN